MKKRILSIILACTLVMSIAAIAMSSASAAVDPKTGRYSTSSNPEVKTRRYYFLMPTNLQIADKDGNPKTINWENKFTEEIVKNDPLKQPVAGAYWWGDVTDGCSSIDGGNPDAPAWPGYKIPYFAETEEGKIFYVDCPADVTSIIFNNYVNGGTDPTAEIASNAWQTDNASSEYYSAGDTETYPDGVGEDLSDTITVNGDPVEVGFNNMIYVVDHEISEVNPTTNKEQIKHAGLWYYFYGDGTYGTYPTKEEAVANNALKGKEIKGEIPTIPTTPAAAPTQPTSATPAPKGDPASSTSDTANNNGAVQTGDSVFAVIVLLSVIACAGVVVFTRKRKA